MWHCNLWIPKVVLHSVALPTNSKGGDMRLGYAYTNRHSALVIYTVSTGTRPPMPDQDRAELHDFYLLGSLSSHTLQTSSIETVWSNATAPTCSLWVVLHPSSSSDLHGSELGWRGPEALFLTAPKNLKCILLMGKQNILKIGNVCSYSCFWIHRQKIENEVTICVNISYSSNNVLKQQSLSSCTTEHTEKR